MSLSKNIKQSSVISDNKRYTVYWFLPMCLLAFSLSTVYNLLRPLKITLVTSSQAGTEIIPFLKVWGVLPMAILFSLLYTRLLKHLSTEKIFFVICLIFMAFFSIFGFILYPLNEHLILHSLGDLLRSYLPKGAMGFICMLEYWHLSLFYLFSELWASVILSMLFWGFANEFTDMNKASQVYAFYSLSSNVGSIAAGQIGIVLSHVKFSKFSENQGFSQSTYSIIITVLFLGALSLMLFYFLTNQTTNLHLTQERQKLPKSKKQVFTLKQSLHELATNRYLLYLSIIVLGYNLIFNLSDVLWTQQLTIKFGKDLNALNAYISKATLYKGIISTLLSIFLTHWIIKRMGWTFAAILTPVMILLTSVFFYPALLFPHSDFLGNVALGVLSMSLLDLTVFMGAAQNSITRALKYSIFDTTKEMSFIPLELNVQRRGKAVIDGIVSRLGKSGGSLLFQVLFLFYSSLSEAIPIVLFISLIMLFFWLTAVVLLGKELLVLHKEREKKRKAS